MRSSKSNTHCAGWYNLLNNTVRRLTLCELIKSTLTINNKLCFDIKDIRNMDELQLIVFSTLISWTWSHCSVCIVTNFGNHIHKLMFNKAITLKTRINKYWFVTSTEVTKLVHDLGGLYRLLFNKKVVF